MTCRIQCAGFRWGRVKVPPLSAADGEFLCLHLPAVSSPTARDEWGEDDLALHLAGAISNPAVTIQGKAVHVKQLLAPRRLFWLFGNPALRHWLTSDAGLSASQADEVMRLCNVPPSCRLCDIAWTPRYLVALRAALARQPQLLVFGAPGMGCDGVEQTYAVVRPQAASLAIVYLSHPSQPRRPCFPSARCIDLEYIDDARSAAA